MASMFFGQYLLAKGAINREALLDALDRQRRSNLSLPELAVQEGLIDRDRAEAIGAAYRMSDQPIEEILAATGGLAREQIERLQHKQRSSWLRIGAALVEGGYLTDDDIAAHLEDYRSLESEADRRIRETMRALDHSEAVSACVELSVFHFSRVTGRPAKLESVVQQTAELEPGRQRFSQRIVGDGDYTIAIDLPDELVAAVAQGMLGFNVDAGSEVEADAVCEYLNLIGGNACTRIEQLGRLLRPRPPIWSGRESAVQPEAIGVKAVVESADIPFAVRVFSGVDGVT
jgi:hypothetical protein